MKILLGDFTISLECCEEKLCEIQQLNMRRIEDFNILGYGAV
jgi:hypothetical protein